MISDHPVNQSIVVICKADSESVKIHISFPPEDRHLIRAGSIFKCSEFYLLSLIFKSHKFYWNSGALVFLENKNIQILKIP